MCLRPIQHHTNSPRLSDIDSLKNDIIKSISLEINNNNIVLLSQITELLSQQYKQHNQQQQQQQLNNK